MKSARFGYVRATSVDDALHLLGVHGPDARFIAGGQSLLASLAFRLSEPSVLIDISKVATLKGVTRTGDVIRIGAGITHTELGANAVVRADAPLLAEAVPHIAHAAIRNRGTIGGSLAYADPAAELPACCVALDAKIVVASKAGTRSIPATDFFTGLLETALAEGEMIVAIEIPARGPDSRSTLYEIVRRSGDYAMAGVAIRADVTGDMMSNPRLAFFGLGDVPVLASGTAAILDGQSLTREQINAAKATLAAELEPNADQHGNEDMKRHLAGVVLERALARLSTPAADLGRVA